LKHIDSLWKLLRDFTIIDPFVNVHPKYRDPLDAKMGSQVAQACEHFDKSVLLPLMKEFIIAQLSEDHISVKESIKTIIGYLEASDTYLVDLPWFHTYFPNSLLMKNIMDVYKLIESS